MGRKPSRNKNLPPGMRARHRGKVTYYFLDTGGHPRKEIALGQDFTAAIMKWSELTITGKVNPALITFRYAAENYMREILPQKAIATQRDNLRELAQLYKFFDAPPAPLNSIEPLNIRQYLKWRSPAKVRANREKALFSHIFNYARETGLTNKPNPCAGVHGFKETGRNTYIDDAVLAAVWEVAEPALRDALDLAYLTGQRPADVLKLSPADIQDGALKIEQNKGGKRLRIRIAGPLAALLERMKQRKGCGVTLINNDKGQPFTKFMLRGAFDRARNAAIKKNPTLTDAIKAFQFRDLRAKAGTDKEESSGIIAAQNQLGHSSSTMTAHYVRHRRGKLVQATK